MSGHASPNRRRAATSGCSRGHRAAEQVFDFQVLFKSKHPAFAPVAGVLVTAERRGWVGWGAIKVDPTGTKAQCNAACAIEVCRIYPAGQSVHRVVGDRNTTFSDV